MLERVPAQEAGIHASDYSGPGCSRQSGLPRCHTRLQFPGELKQHYDTVLCLY